VFGRRLGVGSALLACCAALAGCGGGHSSSGSSSPIVSALESKQVATLFDGKGLAGVRSVSCTSAAGLSGYYHCTATPVLGPCSDSSSGPCDSPLAPTKIWFDCFPNQSGADQWTCQLVSPPAGVNVFTTAAQRAAPKHGIWECKAYNADRQKIGPFLLATTDPHGPVEQRGQGDVSLAMAHQMAAQLHIKLIEVCALP
jgi:hypothetical protein